MNYEARIDQHAVLTSRTCGDVAIGIAHAQTAYLTRSLRTCSVHASCGNCAFFHTSLRILDDDVDLKHIPSAHSREGSPEDEDVPVVAAVLDDRPLHARVAEQYASGQWKTLGKDSSRDVPKSPVQRAGSGTDSDGSPPRKSTHRTRHDSDSDLSPERPVAVDTSRKSPKTPKAQQKEGHARKRTPPSDHRSPSRKGRHESDSDASPPRKKSSPSKTRRSEKSPEKKQRSHRGNHSPADTSSSRHGVSGDPLSDARKRRKESSRRHDPLPERDRHDSDSDLSPHRAGHESVPRGSDSDLSPRRQNRPQKDVALARRRDSDSDLSPPRPGARSRSPDKVKRRGSSSDLSPARRRSPGKSPSPPRSKRCKPEAGRGRPTRGRSSPDKKRTEPEKTQEVVKLRDTSKADRAREAAAKEAERAKAYDKWGKGLAQQEQQTQKLEEHLHEMSKPFSRYEDDEDLEKHLKDQEREGDPMLNYIRKKKKKGVENNLPKYSGPEPPPNRYGIRPGYRWDGVDRSNGFEKKLVEMRNNKKATEEIAYKWSVEEL
ncbi:hypothetical protein HPB47_003908 [Ixodes persulcatus]|uniref:Uncharacterized protein n=1 Tax=Ixodes persulcatus TaxID=34615 RepID=A0AC60PH76_IXOPE|nr:hypothetical protein HPB47_003908 [Ixodes persulcatus]